MTAFQHPRLKRHFAVVPHSADVVELRFGTWNPTSLTLRDDTSSGALYNVLSRLDGTRSIESVARDAGVSRSDAERVIDELLALGLVELGASTALDSYIDQATTPLMRHEGRIAPHRPLLLLGSRSMTSAIATLLGNDVVSTTVVPPDDRLATLVTSGEARWRHDGVTLEATLAQFEPWREHNVIFAADTINPIAFAAMNQIALRHRIAWIHAAIDGPFLLVGPTFVPGRSACYECFERRVAMNLREQSSYVKYKTLLADARLRAPELEPPAAIAGIVASHVALEALSLTRTGNAISVNRVLSIYLPTMEFVWNEVLRVPGCAACGPLGERDDRELYFEMDAVLAAG